MKTLYLECAMGAAGDMLAAALLELLDDPAPYFNAMSQLRRHGVAVSAAPAARCGITGTALTVTVHGAEEGAGHDHEAHDGCTHDHEMHHDHGAHGHDHHHAGLDGICHLISHLALPPQVSRDACAVFTLLAQAESHVHGCPVEQIHFHEVGTMDAVADIVGVCLLVHLLVPERIAASAVHVGSGTVRCAHGVLPVPAPAAAYLLRDVPIYGGAVQGELCTPTGAALLRYFVRSFGPMPLMRTEKIGCGMGKKEFPQANCVRAFWGETECEAAQTLYELRCNVDDMTGEAVGFALETLLAQGALDAWVTPVTMKKSRPAFLLSCLCRESDRARMAELMLRHTTTLGVRESACRRYALARSERTVDTAYGPVRVKESSGYGVTRRKLSYDDRADLMRRHGLTWEETEQLLKK